MTSNMNPLALRMPKSLSLTAVLFCAVASNTPWMVAKNLNGSSGSTQ